MKKLLKALVNGKEVLVLAVKSYDNGIQEVFEGTMKFNDQQVWVAVAASDIIEDITPKARLKAEYQGDRENEKARCVAFTVTAKTKKDAETMMKWLDEYFADEGYEMARCSDVEKRSKGYVYHENIGVENPAEGKEVLKLYKSFKRSLK